MAKQEFNLWPLCCEACALPLGYHHWQSFFNWAIPGLFFFTFILFGLQLTDNQSCSKMSGFEPQTSGVRSDRSSNCATASATAHRWPSFILSFWCQAVNLSLLALPFTALLFFPSKFTKVVNQRRSVAQNKTFSCHEAGFNFANVSK